MPDKKRGIYTRPTDESFVSAEEVKYRLYRERQFPDPIFETPLPEDLDFAYWSQRFRQRAAEDREVREQIQTAEVRFPTTSVLNFIGDIHAGSPDTDYERVEQEVETIINTPNSYAILMGDAIDGYFFNPAQFGQVEQVPAQVQYYRALIQHLAEHKKLIAGWAGDHDEWGSKMGISANTGFSRDTGAYLIKGVGYITVKIGDLEYRVVGTHRPQGHSIYNNAHSAMRLGRDAEGADIIVTAHNHAKAITQQPVKEFGGGSRVVTYVSVGTYKAGDDYSRKMGFPDNSPQAMYGAAVILHEGDKHVSSFYDIMEGNDTIHHLIEP